MRIADIDILIVPACARLDSDHWQARWARNMKTARLVDVVSAGNGLEAATLHRIAEAVDAATRPVALVAHGAGIDALVQAAPMLDTDRVVGAFLVGPESRAVLARDHRLESVPPDRLHFRSVLLASSDHPECTLAEARQLADAWGSTFSEAGNCGRVDVASGHGPWPDGLLRFGVFLKSLDAAKGLPH